MDVNKNKNKIKQIEKNPQLKNIERLENVEIEKERGNFIIEYSVKTASLNFTEEKVFKYNFQGNELLILYEGDLNKEIQNIFEEINKKVKNIEIKAQKEKLAPTNQ